VVKRCWSNVLKAGAPLPMEKGRATGSGRSSPSVSRITLSPEQAATARLEAERGALAAERTRIEQTAAFLENCARCLTEARDVVLLDVQQELVDLVLKVAMQVIHDEVAQRPEVITLQVEKALARVKEDSMMTVRVHPSMLDILRQASPRILESLGPTARVHFEPDSSIAPGGCMVETSQQIVDARIATQLDRIGTALKQAPSP
jgi:flagellar assembly protein FliH